MNKNAIKKKLIEITRAIAFVLVFFVILEVCSLTLFSNKNASGFKNRLQDAYSFVDEPDNTIQIAGVGNSDLYSGFSPVDLWNDFGYTSTICASAQQSIKDSQYLIERVFETQKPTLVIIETDMLYDSNPNERTNVENTNKLSDFFDKAKPEFFERDIENVFSIFKFHNKWKKVESEKASFNTHGYRYNNKVVKLKNVCYMSKTDAVERVSKVNQDQMNNLVQLCRNNGAEVLLVEMPSMSSWNYERHNGTQEYANSINVPFVDLNLLYDEVGISTTNCFRDKGNHLNYNGARNVTSYLGGYINDNYNIPSLKTNKDYESWNKNLAEFKKTTTS